MLKELAMPDVLYQPWCIQSTQSPEGISCGLFHDEAVGDTEGLHQDEGVPFFLKRSYKRLAILTAGYVQHLGRYEVHVLGERPKLRPSKRKFVESSNIQERRCTSIGKDSINYVPHVRTIILVNRLMMMDKNMIDVASDGALMDKIPTAVIHLILNMTSNMQQFGTKGGITSRVVNEVGTINNLRLENQLIELTSLVRLVIGNVRLVIKTVRLKKIRI
ncbi:hypothetical protein CR513_48304, partial [Mucuna pruriens]